MSALSAWMFSAVSRSVSPLVVLLLAASKEITSALRRFAAMSNARRVRGGGGGEGDVVGGDGPEPAAAVDQRGEFDCGRAAMIEQLVERRLHRAAGKQDIVHENDGGAIHIGGDVRGKKFLRDRIPADV